MVKHLLANQCSYIKKCSDSAVKIYLQHLKMLNLLSLNKLILSSSDGAMRLTKRVNDTFSTIINNFYYEEGFI